MLRISTVLLQFRIWPLYYETGNEVSCSDREINVRVWDEYRWSYSITFIFNFRYMYNHGYTLLYRTYAVYTVLTLFKERSIKRSMSLQALPYEWKFAGYMFWKNFCQLFPPVLSYRKAFQIRVYAEINAISMEVDAVKPCLYRCWTDFVELVVLILQCRVSSDEINLLFMSLTIYNAIQFNAWYAMLLAKPLCRIFHNQMKSYDDDYGSLIHGENLQCVQSWLHRRWKNVLPCTTANKYISAVFLHTCVL